MTDRVRPSAALCECGCGLPTSLAPCSDARRGWIKGQPLRFRAGHRARLNDPGYDVVDLGFTSPCWRWRGYVDDEGYARTGRDGRKVLAHRAAYKRVHGPIPTGLTLDHLCRNPACVNPAHLEPVTMRVNTLRGFGPTAMNARKTHCIHGHELTGANVQTSGGGRHCKTCHREISHRTRVA